jgi:hypothetical protein
MHALAIVALCVVSAIVYGIVHDQVTARVCVEYFTIGHPPVFHTEDPTLLGLGWGVIATWWAGAILGVPLAIVAQAGRRPKVHWHSLVRPVLALLAIMAACAFIAGVIGWILAQRGTIELLEPLASQVPREAHIGFLADACAHSTSYLVGFVGGAVVIRRTWRSRGVAGPAA